MPAKAGEKTVADVLLETVLENLHLKLDRFRPTPYIWPHTSRVASRKARFMELFPNQIYIRGLAAAIAKKLVAEISAEGHMMGALDPSGLVNITVFGGKTRDDVMPQVTELIADLLRKNS